MIRMLRDGRPGPMLNTLRFACLALLLVLLHDVSLDSAWGQTGLRRRLQPPVPPPAAASKVDSASTLGKALATCDKVQEDQFVLLRWSQFPGQFGGMAKVDSGFDYAASFSSFSCIA